MSFTYTEDLTVERDFVRFHTGDVREGESLLSDELIASLLVVSANKEAAAVSGLEYLIAVANEPTFSADWLRVDVSSYISAMERRLERKRRDLGITVTSRLNAEWAGVYRPDSQQTGVEVYDADTY